MLKTCLVNPEKDESEYDICLHNLVIADKYHNLSYFMAASMGWFKLNPTKNYQDLELLLRKLDLETHLYAKNPMIPNSKLGLHKKINDSYLYECIFSCRPREYALKEVLEFWSSYEKNFDQLKFAGTIVIDEIDKLEETPGVKKFTDNEMSTHELISSNLKKIKIDKISVKEYLQELDDRCLKTFGKVIDKKIITMNKFGGPIYGFFVNEKLITDIGLSVYTKNFVEITELVKI